MFLGFTIMAFKWPHSNKWRYRHGWWFTLFLEFTGKKTHVKRKKKKKKKKRERRLGEFPGGSLPGSEMARFFLSGSAQIRHQVRCPVWLVVSPGSNKLGHDRRYVRRSSAPFVVHPAFPLAPWHTKTTSHVWLCIAEWKEVWDFFFPSLSDWVVVGHILFV